MYNKTILYETCVPSIVNQTNAVIKYCIVQYSTPREIEYIYYILMVFFIYNIYYILA